MKPMNEQKMKKQMRKALDDPHIKEKLAEVLKAFPKLGENIDILENHMITVQQNQVEFQKYLDKILKNQEKVFTNQNLILKQLGETWEKH